MPSATLPELFAAQAARTPDAVAVVCEDERLSYDELDARSSQLAHHLRALGVGAEVVVGLCVERSPALLVALIGILKAGGAYLPLDPDYPRERLAYMLADAGAAVLVTQSALRDRLPATAARMVQLDADGRRSRRSPSPRRPVASHPHNTAYVIYTSGSTGTPKGVAVAHRIVCSFESVRGFQIYRCLPSARCVCCSHRSASIASIAEIFWSISTVRDLGAADRFVGRAGAFGDPPASE